MLAQSFKSATDLGITEPQKEALMKTLVLLETGKLRHVAPGGAAFDGRPPSFGGTAQLVGALERGELDAQDNRPLRELFYPYGTNLFEWKNITVTQAATALRSYLTTGDAKWHEAVA